MSLRLVEGRILDRSAGCLARDCTRCRTKKCAPQYTLSSQPSFYKGEQERDGVRDDEDIAKKGWVMDLRRQKQREFDYT